MHDIPNRIADILLEVEAKLRLSGKWQQQKPSAKALSSTMPFCVDTLTIEQWLQWVFLPRMKGIIEDNQPLPTQSGIFSYAQECYAKPDPAAADLLTLIKRFDDLIAIQAGTTKYH